MPNPNVYPLKRQCGPLRRLTFGEEEIRSGLIPVHIYSILIAADYQRIRITEPLILGVILIKTQAGPFTDGNLLQKVSQKKNSFSRLAKKSLRSCAHSKIQGQQRTRRSMKISSGAPENTDGVLRNEIALENSYSAS